MAGVQDHHSDHNYYRIDNGEKVKLPNPHSPDLTYREFHNIIGKAGMTSLQFYKRRARTSVWMPTEATNVWRVTYSDPANIGRAGSDVVFLIDARTGALVRADRYETDSSVQRLLRWQLPLHSGKALGTWGRVAVLISGFVPLALFITGLLIWRRKRAT